MLYQGQVDAGAEMGTYNSGAEETKEPTDYNKGLVTDVDEEDAKENSVLVTSLAKKPWLDGWVLARAFALRYIRESKEYYTDMGLKPAQIRQLPTQLMIRYGWLEPPSLLLT